MFVYLTTCQYQLSGVSGTHEQKIAYFALDASIPIGLAMVILWFAYAMTIVINTIYIISIMTLVYYGKLNW
jgi:hypothetical protein